MGYGSMKIRYIMKIYKKGQIINNRLLSLHSRYTDNPCNMVFSMV